jgi:hypothetical protein
MATGFYVNLEHLGSFGNQVRRNHLYYYSQVDNDQAARLDRAYQPADLATAVGTTAPIAPGTKVSTARPIAPSEVRHDPHPRPGHRELPLDYTAKDYHWVNLQPLQKRGANTEPGAVFGQNWVLEVDEAAKNVKDALPSISVPPVRIALERILGENAVQKISELVTGDWLAVEKVARALHWHGQVQQDLHDNLMRGLEPSVIARYVKDGMDGPAQQWALRDRHRSGNRSRRRSRASRSPPTPRARPSPTTRRCPEIHDVPTFPKGSFIPPTRTGTAQWSPAR